MFQRFSKNPITSIALIVLLMTITSFDYLPVSIMEARNFVTAREMVNDGHWLLTTMNGEARYEKPPLPTWLSAVSATIFGTNNVFAYRLPAILMLFIIGITSFILGKRLLNEKRQAFIISLVAISSFYVIGIIIEAPWDIFAHGFMLLGITFIFTNLKNQLAPIRNWVFAAVFMGCSILSKGPISPYALLLPFLLAYGFIYFKSLNTKKIYFVIIVLLVSVIIGGWWFLYVRYNDPIAFMQVAEKESSNWGAYNIRPFYYYWSFFIQSGIWTIPAFISLLYPYLKTRVSNLKAYQFSLLWTLLAVIILSFIPEKKSRYLMPVLIPLAFNTSFYIDYLFRKFKNIKSYAELVPVYFYFGLLAIICFVIPISAFFMKDYFTDFNIIWYSLSAISLLFLGLSIFFGLKKKNAKTLFLTVVGIMVSILLFLPPLYNKMNRNHYNNIKKIADQAEVKNLQLYAMDHVSPEVIWEYGSKIPVIMKDSKTFDFPKEESFGLLVNKWSENIEKTLISNNYKYVKLTTYNLNRDPKDSRSYRGRLENELYLVTKF